jgi:uncharacterized protein (DUF488 family)
VATIYTLGHSTRPLPEFLSVLHAHQIAILADIRSIPMSRRHPHFNREALEKSLLAESIEYLWMKDLGGRRKKQMAESQNSGLRNQSFRNYADHMLSESFHSAAEQLIEFARAQRIAIMCAELLFFRCHRMLVSDYLSLHGHDVLHIQDTRPTRPHQVTREARLIQGKVLYGGDQMVL